MHTAQFELLDRSMEVLLPKEIMTDRAQRDGRTWGVIGKLHFQWSSLLHQLEIEESNEKRGATKREFTNKATNQTSTPTIPNHLSMRSGPDLNQIKL